MRSSRRHGDRRMRATAGACMLAAVLVAATGCIDVDGELGADGSLSMRYTYDPPRHATFASERSRLASEHVRVEHLEAGQTIDGYPPNEFATATLVVDDATKLGTARAFADVGVVLDLTERRLVLTLPGLEPDARARALAATDGMDRRAVRLSLVLPGTAADPSPAAATDGRRVTWTLSIRDYAAAGDTVTLATSWSASGSDAPAHSM